MLNLLPTPQASLQLLRAAGSLLGVLSIVLAACTDPTGIGSELIVGDDLQVRQVDDFSLRFDVLRGDTVLAAVARRNNAAALGCLDDPITGLSRSGLAFEISPRDTPFVLPSNVTVDSAVLVLPLRTDLGLGDLSSGLSLQVTGIAEGSLREDEPLLTDLIEPNDRVYAEGRFTVPSGAVTVNNFLRRDTVTIDTVAAQVRIPLGGTFVADLEDGLRAARLQDSTFSATFDSTLFAAFTGLLIRSTACEQGLAAVDLGTTAETQIGVHLYFRTDTVRAEQVIGPVRPGSGSRARVRLETEFDYTGSAAQALLDDRDDDDAGGIVQAPSGLQTRIELLELDQLANNAVLLAVLELPVQPGSDSTLAALPRLLPRVRNSVGDLEDFTGVQGSSQFALSEGGALQRLPDRRAGAGILDSVDGYRFILTDLVRDIAAGQAPAEVFITSVPAPTTLDNLRLGVPAGQSLLVGPSNIDTTVLRPRLVVTLTGLP